MSLGSPLLPFISSEDIGGTKGEIGYTVDLGFKKLGLVLHDSSKTRVLDSVTGCIEHGRLTAVMGPSGSGKTTFITTLAGRAHYGEQLGRITMNGIPGSPALLRKFVGFVPQEDTMVRCLTVSEVLSHEAALRSDRRVTQAARKSTVEKTLSILGLSEIKDSLIGDELARGISGGQRKRVNIGLELVANPTILFLDEPTSGLDATASAEVVRALANVAHNTSMTVVAVVHQPRFEIFMNFDDILLLGKGGRTAYLGKTDGALDHFLGLGFVCPEHTNPPDFFLDVITDHSIDVFQAWEQRLPILSATDPNSTLAIDDDEDADFVPSRGLFGDQMSAKNDNALALFLFGLSTGLFCMSGCIWVQDWVRRGFVSRLGVFAFCAGCLIAWQLWCIGAVILCMVSWFQYPLKTAAEQPSSFQAFTAGYLFVFPIVGATYVVLWLVCLILSFAALRKLREQYTKGGGALPVVSGLLAFGVPVFGVLLVYNSSGRFLDESARKAEEQAIMRGQITAAVDQSSLTADVDNVDIQTALELNVRRFGLYGFLAQIFFTATVVLTIFGAYFWAGSFRCRGCATTSAWSIVILFLDLCIFLVCLHRKKHLPTRDKRLPNFASQVFGHFWRGVIIQFRNPMTAVFDIGVCLLSGLFLGLIYMNEAYIGGLSKDGYDACVAAAQECKSILQNDTENCDWSEVCGLAKNDPIIGMASLGCMSISLAAMTGGQRVFGDLKAVFQRSAWAGGSTEAFYIGMSLSQLPISILAPLAYLGPFYALTTVRSTFWELYLLLVILHMCSTGFSFALSILLPPSTGQLGGILLVLVSMMFCGGNPTLPTLFDKGKLGGILGLPSYLSFVRWAQNAVYLLEIKHYKSEYYVEPEMELWGYSFEGSDSYYPASLDQCTQVLVIMTLVARMAAYVTLVKTEP